MQKTKPILRRNINKVIEISVLICFIVLIGTLAMQPIQCSQSSTKKVSETLTAGINQHFDKVLKEQKVKNTSLTAGANRHFMEVLKEKSKETRQQAKVEKLNVETVTTSTETTADATETEEVAEVEETEQEILYKSLDEVKILRDMDLTETTGLSKEDFCKLLANFKYDYAGFYKRNAGLIWDFSQESQVNEIFMCGVFGIESFYGSSEKHIANHNYGSIMVSKVEIVKDENGKTKKIKKQELKPYLTDAEGIEANFKLFANCYLSPEGKYYKGVTLDSIGDTYCPPTPECPSWADKVYCCMQYFLE